jgi:hypothetical protein
MVFTKVYEKFNVPIDGEEYEENTSFFGPKNLNHLKPEIVEPCDDCKLCVKNEKPSLRKYTKGKRKRVEEAFTTPPHLPFIMKLHLLSLNLHQTLFKMTQVLLCLNHHQPLFKTLLKVLLWLNKMKISLMSLLCLILSLKMIM